MTNEELYRRYIEGDSEAFDLLYKQLERFIGAIATETARSFGCAEETMIEDLRGEGALELWERLQSGGYEESAGKLTTYLYPHLRGRMRRFLETNLGVMALSKDEMERVRTAQRLYHEQRKTVEEIAAELGVSVETAARAVNTSTYFLSVYDLPGLDEDGETGDPLERVPSHQPSPEEVVFHNISLELLEPLFQKLSAKDRAVLGHTYGVYGYEQLTADELGLREMLSADGVTKARKTALEHLQRLYPDSDLRRWREAKRMIREARALAETDSSCCSTPQTAWWEEKESY